MESGLDSEQRPCPGSDLLEGDRAGTAFLRVSKNTRARVAGAGVGILILLASAWERVGSQAGLVTGSEGGCIAELTGRSPSQRSVTRTVP